MTGILNIACWVWSPFCVQYLTLLLQVIHTSESLSTRRSSMLSAPKKLPWNLPPVQTTSLQRWQRKRSTLLNSFSSSNSTNSFPASVRTLRSVVSIEEEADSIAHCYLPINSTFLPFLTSLGVWSKLSCCLVVLQMQPGESLLVKPITRCDSGTQTDIHPVETNIVRSYEWNEWELRRKAIKLVSQSPLDAFTWWIILTI